MRDKTGWSIEAHRAHKSAKNWEAYQCWVNSELRAGPRLVQIVVVPSPTFNAEIAEFFKSQGFVYNSTFKQWWRDPRVPAKDGKLYTPEQWLESARRKFFEIWKVKPAKKDSKNAIL